MKGKKLSRLARIIDKTFRWFPMFKETLHMKKSYIMLGVSKEMIEHLVVKKESSKYSSRIYSEQHRRDFDIKNDTLRVENDSANENKLKPDNK